MPLDMQVGDHIGLAKNLSVDIVVPCFNAAKTLRDTVSSVIRSSGQITVIDDGSTDQSLDIAREFQPHVRVLTGPNRGASAARNLGIAESTGEWLVFLDADDQFTPRTIEYRLAIAAEHPEADVIVCGWQERIDIGSEMKEGSTRRVDRTAIEDDAEIATATHVWAPPAALMYRRSLVNKIGGFRVDLPVIQDARFLFDAAFHGARFAFSDHVGALYRIQEGSLSRRDPARFWLDCLLNGTQIEALWQARGTLNKRYREALAGIYYHAARGLFQAESPKYFEAVQRERALGVRLPRHSRIAPPIARAIGLHSARQLFALVGR